MKYFSIERDQQLWPPKLYKHIKGDLCTPRHHDFSHSRLWEQISRHLATAQTFAHAANKPSQARIACQVIASQGLACQGLASQVQDQDGNGLRYLHPAHDAAHTGMT